MKEKSTKKRRLWITALPLILSAACLWMWVEPAKAARPIVIVIDPGHGGENLGGEYNEYTEKDMTPIVAEAMKEELEKYQGVTVYLTRNADVDMTIKDRALFAAEKNADFLFCLHFNMSVNHNLFGSEVWVPATDEYFSKGYAFAEIQMKEFTDLGLYSRGIKTRINDRNENYYGILRYCSAAGIPSALIEHCHLDHPKDQPFYQQETEEQLKEFGRMDAAAVAKYFHLKSDILGVDYSDYPVSEIPIPEGIVRPDETEPEICTIEVTDINTQTGEVTVHMNAKDNDSYILYYNYSLNGGNTYSDLMEWPRPDEWNKSLSENTFTVTVPFDQEIELRAMAYNGFDVWTESEILHIDPIPDPERLKREAKLAKEQALREQQEAYQEISIYENADEVQSEEASPAIPLPLIVLLGIILIAVIFVSFLMARKIDLLLKDKIKR
ncbi:MAG: N-acetylmuramoyl-L-alanine amidase [Bacillota bacterium]|nr:N-acetylmuramoyl-L-alanine amidase [Bacillota bacterium]